MNGFSVGAVGALDYGNGVDTEEPEPEVDPDAMTPRERARRIGLTATGAGLLVVGGPVVGVLTPMFPLGIVVAGVGAGLVVRNSPKGRRMVQGAWDRYPKLTQRCPPKVRKMIFGGK